MAEVRGANVVAWSLCRQQQEQLHWQEQHRIGRDMGALLHQQAATTAAVASVAAAKAAAGAAAAAAPAAAHELVHQQ